MLPKEFIVSTNENMQEYTNEDSFVLELGNFGLVSRAYNGKSEDDFTLAITKPHLFKDYVLFVAEKNIGKKINSVVFIPHRRIRI